MPPDAPETKVVLEETAPGRFTAENDGAEQGLYRLAEGRAGDGDALGPAAPREFEETTPRSTGWRRWPIRRGQ